MRVGIVSFEFEGVTRNGGIGTAYRLLAETLAASGAEVTVLLTQKNYSDADLKRAQSSLRAKGITLTPVPASRRHQSNPWFVAQSMTVYERLRSLKFDIVHFPENIGSGYHSVLAKKLGLDFKETFFVAGLHGSTSWIKDVVNQRFPSEELTLLFELEKRSVELADLAISPSEYMLDYVKTQGWKVPAGSTVIPNVNRLSDEPRAKKRICQPARQLVFFGRLEERKGVIQFVRAIQQYFAQGKPPSKDPLPVVFLGRELPLASGEPASAFIRRELAPLGPRVRLQFKTDLSSEAAIQYLRDHSESLVCMPSPIDNSPYVLVEALEEGFNFISSSKGGQGELIHPEDRKLALFDPDDLARKLRERLFWIAPRVRPAPELARSSARWVELHETILSRGRTAKPNRAASESAPLVSICIAPSHHAHASQSLIEGLEFGLYSPVEVLIGEGKQELEATRTEVRSVFAEPGKPWMRRLANAAKGKYVLFIERSAVIQPHAISLFVNLAERGGLDRLCSAFLRISTEHDAESVLPMPEHAMITLLSRDPRVPLLFVNRKRFLADSKGFDCQGELYSEQALWVLESTLSGKSFSCVPKVLVSTTEWVPSMHELEKHRNAACDLIASQMPGALSALARTLICAKGEASRAQMQLQARITLEREATNARPDAR